MNKLFNYTVRTSSIISAFVLFRTVSGRGYLRKFPK